MHQTVLNILVIVWSAIDWLNRTKSIQMHVHFYGIITTAVYLVHTISTYFKLNVKFQLLVINIC